MILEGWQLIATILGVSTIVVSGLVTIFKDRAQRAHGASRSEVHDIDKRLAVMENEIKNMQERMERQGKEIGRIAEDVSKISDLLIKWARHK